MFIPASPKWFLNRLLDFNGRVFPYLAIGMKVLALSLLIILITMTSSFVTPRTFSVGAAQIVASFIALILAVIGLYMSSKEFESSSLKNGRYTSGGKIKMLPASHDRHSVPEKPTEFIAPEEDM